MSEMNYEKAGVSIKTGDEIVDSIKDSVHKTHRKGVLSSIGGFAGLFDIKAMCEGYDEPVLVQSIDGVGTKSLVASLANNFQTIGQDLVSATVNDILVCGARPYTLLDYVASGKLSVNDTSAIIQSIAKACESSGIALLGGETAEMPDTYCDNAYDIVGIVTGVVEQSKMIDGRNIKPGDVILGLPSSGLHTNGFSLARRVLFDKAGLTVDTHVESLGMTVGEALLMPHKNYQASVLSLLDRNLPISGMAHITGGGIKGNLARVLPKQIDAQLSLQSVPIPGIFSLIQDKGDITFDAMYQAFNMGVGYILVCSKEATADITQTLTEINAPYYELGEMTDGCGEVKLV